MNRSILYRVGAFAALTVAAVVCLVPTAVEAPYWWPWHAPVRLGLDLRGGTHLLYQVDIEKAVDAMVERSAQDLEGQLRKAQIGASTVERQGRTILVRLANKAKREEAQGVVAEEVVTLVPVTVPGAEADLAFELDPREERRIRDNVVEQALKIIRNRIDQFGVAEPTVVAQGSDQIVIQLPGIQDPQRAKALIGRTAVLEFKLVAEGPNRGTAEHPGPGVEVLHGSGPGGGRQTYLVERRTLMTGDVLKDARVVPASQFEGMAVEFELDSRGARRFGELTEANVSRQLAIVLDDKVESAPVIKEAIPGGRGLITGNFPFAEAQDLANVLRNGALPAPLELLEERTVGPSLGTDSIRRGAVSFIAGGALVVLFMVGYYRYGGVIAVAAVLANVLFLLGTFAAFGFTMTLPGIAGIVLTVGMAVDANVLILERMREELRLGKSARAAVEAGYEHAWSAIRDSNITTFASGLILFNFGSGPVRGFAVTLCLGIVTSIVTAVFGTRVVYDLLAARRRLATVSV